MLVYKKLHSTKTKTDGSEATTVELFTHDDGKEKVYMHVTKMNGEVNKLSLDKVNAIKFSLNLVDLINKL